MNSRRVKSSIKALERDISNYEAFLSEIFKSKDQPKSNEHKPEQNGPVPIRTKPVTFSPSVLPEIKSHRDKTQSSNTENRVLTKNIFEDDNAVVGSRVTTKATAASKSRKRPSPDALSTAPKIDRAVEKEEIQKQSNLSFQPPGPSKCNRNDEHDEKSQLYTNHRLLPWALILKDKNTPCIIHKTRTKAREDVNQERLHHKPRRPRHSLKRSHKYLVPEDSTDDGESPNDVNRRVQHSLPKSIIPYDKQNDIPLSKHVSKYNTSDGAGKFSMFSPVGKFKFLGQSIV
jgi:hypothetical protein